MKNFAVKVNEKEYWISRSVAIVVFIFRKINNNIEVLTEIRGKGVDHCGSRCVVCGYLEYDQTLEDACVAETFQETGMIIDKSKLRFIEINSDPIHSNHQNVSVHYIYEIHGNEEINMNIRYGGEKDEVEKVEWINVNNLPCDFCFEHDKYIKNYVKCLKF